jgi:hypothetical protein
VAASTGGDGDGHASGLQALRAAHEKLLRDHSLQFDFKSIVPPKTPDEPQWMRDLARFLGGVFEAIMPVLVWIFWAGVALAVAAILYMILREVVGIRFQRRRRAAKARAAPADWRPEAWKARALLEDADRLAAEGNYDEAAHLLLYRSIDDIEGRRPRLVRPALTARDIAALEAVPGPARDAFSHIARIVESSFFGGRSVDQAGFAECRRAYESFVFPEVWA